MGAADDIKQGLTKTLAPFTKQRKSEEKQSSNYRWRQSRMVEVRGKFLTEAADEVMEDCYNKASGNGSLPALARQIYYVARPLVEDLTDKPLRYDYFSQTLLPDYVREHGKEAEWDVVYDDRGHFSEPHSKRIVGLGTLNVRAYLSRVKELEVAEADFDPAGIRTYGPDGSFGSLLYVEKEGFMPLFKRVKLGKRYDMAIMSSKGMAVTAARDLVDSTCSEYNIPLLVLHERRRPRARKWRLTRDSVHESGHAVAFLILDQPFDYVMLWRGKRTFGHMIHRPPADCLLRPPNDSVVVEYTEHELIMLYAAGAAVELFFPRANSGAYGDVKMAERILRKLHPNNKKEREAYREHCKNETWKLVNKHRNKIERVAAALERWRVLTDYEVSWLITKPRVFAKHQRDWPRVRREATCEETPGMRRIDRSHYWREAQRRQREDDAFYDDETGDYYG
jgi:hypothetical protein